MSRWLILLFALVACFSGARAQISTSQINGVVTDSSGAVVPGASVTLTNEATGVVWKQNTTEAGVYAFPAIPVGSYTIRVEAPGFKVAIRSGNIVQVNTPLAVNIQLEVGAASESVQVTASSEVLQTSSATLGNVVEQKAIVSLPLNGRNPLNLLMYEPGVTQRSGNTINVNGARSTAVNVTIDGIESNESTNPNPINNIFRLNPDNVQEFKVTTQNPTAEEGRNSGANVAIATRSGTNEFHGTLFEFFRNTALNAQEFFAAAQGSPKPVIQLNQYGFELGGPIRKNRTFFFGSWQGQKVNFADPVDKAFGESVDLYTPTALSGIFRYFVVDPLNPLFINGQRITQNSPLLVDPATGNLAPGIRNCTGPGDSNCVASYNVFANDPLRIGMDSAVKAVLGRYPAPNSYNAGDGLNTGIYQWNTPVRVRGPHWMFRIDHTINSKHSVFGRYLHADQDTLGGDPLNGRPVVIPGFPPRGEVFRPARNLAIGVRSVLSPRLVNELTLGFSRWRFLFTQGEANPLFPNTPRFTFNNSDVDYTANPRTARTVTTPQINENLSFLTGKHVLRFGASMRFYQHNDQRGDVGGTSLTPSISLSRTVRPPVGFNFPAQVSATTPGISAVDLNRLQGMVNDLLGIPAGLTQVFMGDLRSDTFLPFRSGDKVTLWAQGQRTKQFHFYAQDEWKVRRNVTLSLGLRWELNTPPTEAGGRVYVPNKSIDGREGPVTFVPAKRWFQNFNTTALAPRLGVTWAPGKASKMVIRAGYGIAFDALNTFQVTSVAAAVPGQTFRCSSQFSGAGGALVTTPGCQPVPDIRLGAGFPNEMNPPNVKPSSFLTPPAQVSANAPPARVFDQNLKMPTVHMWNFTIQRELPGSYVLSVGYVGRRGIRLFRSWDANQISPDGILPSFLAMQRNLALGGGCRPDGTLPNGNACPGASPVPLIQRGVMTSAFANSAASVTDLGQNAAGNMAGRLEQATLAAGFRPNPQFAQILMIDNGADSNYHAAQLTLRKRFDRAGLLLNGAYTLGKSIDVLSIDPVLATVGGGLTTTNARTPADGRNYRNERARSDFDQRHVVNITGIYELPFGRGKALLGNANRALNLVVGGWSINGIYTYQSGEPFTVRSGVLSHNSTAQSRAALRPGAPLPKARLQSRPGVVGPVFFADTNDFVLPEPGGLGIGRNVFQGPSYWNLDAGISKGFQISERVRLVFRTELFNALNHPNFRNPRDASVGSPAITSGLFGQACCVTLSTASSASVNQNGESWRVIQLALKLSF
ncbi:MAG: TonB-dependent receptor [Bryobacteraceae bacterium]|nr:TonB-dependent receptor [Bryobacteraceae bacterium]MDW8378472.1 TonB-dependent receptor [Bryobacterales bacterium]